MDCMVCEGIICQQATRSKIRDHEIVELAAGPARRQLKVLWLERSFTYAEHRRKNEVRRGSLIKHLKSLTVAVASEEIQVVESIRPGLRISPLNLAEKWSKP